MMNMRNLIAIALVFVVCGRATAQTATFTDVVVKDNLTVSNAASLLSDVVVGGQLTVTNNLTVNGTAAVTNLNVASDLSVYGFSYFYKTVDIINAALNGSSAWFTNWLRVDGSSDFYNNVDFNSGNIRVLSDANLSVDGYLYTYGTNKIASWDRLQIDSGGETLPAYVSNVVNIATQGITAESLGAMTNETDTLATVLARGNNAAGLSVTNFADMSGTGRRMFGIGLSLVDVASNAYGAMQSGLNEGVNTISNSAHGAIQNGLNSGTRTVGAASYGAIQNGINYGTGVQTISGAAYGALQNGYNDGIQIIDVYGYGAIQSGLNQGSQTIGYAAVGASQRGSIIANAAATNNGVGAMQLFDLTSGQKALTTAGGDASILIGAGTASNKNAIVAGDGEVSHGDGSITAGGGFYGPSATLAAALTASNIVQTSGGWDDLLFPVNTIYAVGLTDIEYLPQSNSINFKATCNTNFASDNVWLVGQLSHSTKTNSAYIHPHVHFAQSSATATNMFFLRYKRYKIGEQIPTTWTDLPLTNNVFSYSTGTIHQIANGAYLSGPFGISENLDFKIWSRGGQAVQLKFFDIHFQRDGMGSDLEYQKTF